MAEDNRALNWPAIGQVALNLIIIGLLVVVFLNDRRLSASEQQAQDLGARVAETAAAAAKAEPRIASLEKAAADAKSDRDGLREAAAKLGKSVEAGAAALAGAQQKIAGLESAETQAQSDREALRQAGDKAAAAAAATKSALDETVAGLTDAKQKLAEVADGLATLKPAEAALEQDQRNLASAIEATTASVAKLRADVSWRELAAGTRTNLEAAPSKAGPNAINMMYIANDSESHAFANQVGAAFKAAGWRVNYVAASFPGLLITGMVLNKADNQPTSDAAAAFQASGLDVLATEVPDPTESVGGDREGIPVTLVIGAHALR